MFKKNHLDEMQEQKLLRIESRGCWLAFWGLLAAIVVQQVIYGYEFSHIAGEWIVFMALALYQCVACARSGIWDRRLKADRKTNALLSLIAAAVVGVVVGAGSYARYRALAGSVAAGVITAVQVFILCFVGVTLVARYTKKRQAELEKEPEDEEE